MSGGLDYLLRRGVVEIIVEEELRKLLSGGRPLRLKMGFDPTRPHLHLGYAVALRKLRQFQELGHQVILIVGDWTAQIGDPSEQATTRSMLTAEEVQANAQTYMRQFFKIVDPDKTQVAWQSQWFGNFTMADVIRLTSRFTVAQMLAREDFQNRYTSGRPIAVTELLYPMLQGYDSVMIEADVEFGGSDQKFNCLVGRELQSMMGQPPQQVFLMPLLVGTDGRKMSQSLGNYIAFEAPPNDMYGKVMSIPDSIMMDYFELLTDVPEEELGEMARKMAEGSVNPMDYKMRLAREITFQFHGPEAVQKAQAHFTRVFRQRGVPEEMLEVKLELLPVDEGESPKIRFTWQDKYGEHQADINFGGVGTVGWFKEQGVEPLVSPQAEVDIRKVLVVLGLVKSLTEVGRLLAQGALELDGKRLTLTEGLVVLKSDSVLRVGKRRFVKFVGD